MPKHNKKHNRQPKKLSKAEIRGMDIKDRISRVKNKHTELGFVETLYLAGDYAGIVSFLLLDLPNSIVNVNHEKGCVEIYINGKLHDDIGESLMEFKARIGKLTKKLSSKQVDLINKHIEHNSHKSKVHYWDRMDDGEDDDTDEDEGDFVRSDDYGDDGFDGYDGYDDEDMFYYSIRGGNNKQ